MTSPSASASPSPTQQPVPDIVGKSYLEARSELNEHEYMARVVGKDGKAWTENIVPDESVMAVSMNPAAGSTPQTDTIHVTVNMTEEGFKAASAAKKETARIAAEEAKLAARYTYTCGGPGTSEPEKSFQSFKEVWTSLYYTRRNGCSLYLDGTSVYDTDKLLPQEQKIVDIVAANGGDASIPGFAYAGVFSLCANNNPDYADELPAKPQWKKAEALAALAMCPDAPHAAALQEAATAVKISDGNKIVGKDMEAGTYSTKPGVKNCYWSRNTGSGSIIENDFVGFAPDGATVTVYAGEGFESSGCGIWTKIG
uniref:Uncharacterized protein n=2 Tax=Paenarthrobacter nicotinovorans TaxID=29320 RepID=Q8GAF7_PAENI|nr:PASTA domain-containing protein [Paenarthrobacter nicotinovorans]CAD47974.1 hypothetical protein [Paenarthrobacter nicotinovorans]